MIRFDTLRFTYHRERIMKKTWLTPLVLGVLFASISFSGCVTTFTPTGQLQVGLSTSASENPPEVLADFEASEESSVAGDVTKKSGSSCAGGVCTIY